MGTIVVLGGNGMAGHVLKGWLSEQGYRVIATERSGADGMHKLDLRDTERLRHLLSSERPEVVFSGRAGSYAESSLPDGTSVYAKTKSLGEVVSPNHLTIRTSIIGPELKRGGIGLLHWFLMREDPVEGYENVYWNGVTTLE